MPLPPHIAVSPNPFAVLDPTIPLPYPALLPVTASREPHPAVPPSRTATSQQSVPSSSVARKDGQQPPRSSLVSPLPQVPRWRRKELSPKSGSRQGSDTPTGPAVSLPAVSLSLPAFPLASQGTSVPVRAPHAVSALPRRRKNRPVPDSTPTPSESTAKVEEEPRKEVISLLRGIPEGTVPESCPASLRGALRGTPEQVNLLDVLDEAIHITFSGTTTGREMERFVTPACIDTGASITCMSHEAYRALGRIVDNAREEVPLTPLKKGFKVVAAGGESLPILGTVSLTWELPTGTRNVEALVVRGLLYPLLLGRDVLSTFTKTTIFWRGSQCGEVHLDDNQFMSTWSSFHVKRARKLAALRTELDVAEAVRAEKAQAKPSLKHKGPREKPDVEKVHRRVHPVQKVRVGPRCRQLVEVVVAGDLNLPGEMGVFVANPDRTTILPASGTHSLDNAGRMKVWVINPAEGPRWLTPSADLGHFESAEWPASVLTISPVEDCVVPPSPAASSESFDTFGIDLSHLGDPATRRMYEECMDEFADGLDDGKTPYAYDESLPAHEIDTGNHRPIRQKVRRFAPAIKEAELEAIKQLKARGVIRESKSEWGFPVVMVPKKDGTYRMCIDYRALNDATVKDSYPLPDIKECLATLCGMKIFSTLDAKGGFWQVPMHPRDASKTAFLSNHGLFEFNGMPMGLCNAPASFQRLMNALLAGLNWLECLVFIDDIIIFSKTHEEHVQRLRKVLTALRGKIRLNGSKCHIAKPSLVYLGHLISAEGIQMDPSKHKAVSGRERPTNVAELQSWLGLGNWYRKFIDHYTQLVKPFAPLLCKTTPWHWTEEHEKAFLHMKDVLTSSPLLAWPDPSLPYTLYTDGSKSGLGAILEQEKDGVRHPVMYWSRSTHGGEPNYTTSELELLAMVESIREFRPYIAGTKFKLVTDHWALKWLRTLKDPDGRLGRWALKLQGYDFDVEYRKGADNHADYLSRPPKEYLETHPEQVAAWDFAEQPSPKPEPSKQRPARKPPVQRNGRKEATAVNTLRKIPGRESPRVDPVPRLQAVTALSAEQCRARRSAQETDSWLLDAAATVCSVQKLATLSPLQEPKTLDSWKEEQRRDTELMGFVRYLETQHLPENPQVAGRIAAECTHLFLDKSGVLRSCPRGRGLRQANTSAVIVCPSVFRRRVLEECHDSALAGHFALQKTIARVSERCWWPRVFTDVLQYVSSCPSCQENKAPKLKGRQSTPLSIPVGEPFHMVGVDFVGPLPRTAAGNEYALVFTDYLTKWPEAFATPNCTASTVAQFLLEDIIPRHGCPAIFLSDRAQAFWGKVMEAVNKIVGIKHIFSSAWHPQTNGLTERFNKTLCQTLKSYCNKRHKDWDVFLPYALFAYRTSKQSSTGQTPFFLTYGREARMPLDWETDKPYDKQYKNAEDYRRVFVQGLQIARQLARDAIEVAQHEQRRHREEAEPKVSTHKYEVGDLVLLYNTQRSDKKKGRAHKFLPLWIGPYRITRIGGPNHFYVADLDGQPWKGTVNITRLRPFKERIVPVPPALPAALPDADSEDAKDQVREERDQDAADLVAVPADADEAQESKDREADPSSAPSTPAPSPLSTPPLASPSVSLPPSPSPSPASPPSLPAPPDPPSKSDSDDGFFQVENVLRRRWDKDTRKWQYLVRWVGYTRPTWEPEDNLTPDLVEWFKKGKPAAVLTMRTGKHLPDILPLFPRDPRLVPLSAAELTSRPDREWLAQSPTHIARFTDPITGYRFEIRDTGASGYGLFAREHIPAHTRIPFLGVVSKQLVYGPYVIAGGQKATGLVWINGDPKLNDNRLTTAAMVNEPSPYQWANCKTVPVPGGVVWTVYRPDGIPAGAQLLGCYGQEYRREYPHRHEDSHCRSPKSIAQWRARMAYEMRRASRVWRRVRRPAAARSQPVSPAPAPSVSSSAARSSPFPSAAFSPALLAPSIPPLPPLPPPPASSPPPIPPPPTLPPPGFDLLPPPGFPSRSAPLPAPLGCTPDAPIVISASIETPLLSLPPALLVVPPPDSPRGTPQQTPPDSVPPPEPEIVPRPPAGHVLPMNEEDWHWDYYT